MKRSLRVVIADDEPEMITYLRETLEEVGHRVASTAESGEELVAKCMAERPDLVICDIKMEGMDGIDAAKEIYRELPIPFILVSAYHDSQLLERAEADHIMAYLIKPIKKSHLEAAIGIAVRRFEQFQMLSREAKDLKQALEDRKIIERAKGILMKQAKLDEDDAFKRLQELASNKNQKMIEIARMILTMQNAFAPRKEHGSKTATAKRKERWEEDGGRPLPKTLEKK
jgi:response regulator NasT